MNGVVKRFHGSKQSLVLIDLTGSGLSASRRDAVLHHSSPHTVLTDRRPRNLQATIVPRLLRLITPT
jgi:hypothetical protein